MAKQYVDNKKMYEVLCEYKRKEKEAILNDGTRPKIPEYFGECLLLIARKLSTKPIFYKYPYKEDMISDGVESCLLYMDNFDPEKSQNPFSYFTQIIYYAFLRRIQGEKKHLYIQYKLQENNGFGAMNYDGEKIESNRSGRPQEGVDSEKINNFINDYEKYKGMK